MASRTGISSLCPVVAYDEEHEVFLNDDRTLGFGFLCQPLPGTTDSLQAQVVSLLTTDFPPGTTMSFMLFRSPDIDDIINGMLSLRVSHIHKLLTPIVVDRANFLRYHTRNGLVSSVKGGIYDSGIIVDVKLIVSVKLPVNNGLEPSVTEMETASEYRSRVQSALKEMGFAPQTMNARVWLRIMSTVFNWGDGASWRNTCTEWNRDMPLCDQFFDFDTDLDDTDPSRMFFGLGTRMDPRDGNPDDIYESYVQMLSPKTWPSSMWFGNAIRYMGDFQGSDKTVKENYAIISTVLFPDHNKRSAFFSRKRQTTAKFAYGPLFKLQPRLGLAMDDLESYNNDLSTGGRALQMTLSVMLFAPTRKRLLAASTALQQQFEIDHFKLMQDKGIQREMFQNCLPMCAERAFLFTNESHRSFSVTSNTCGTLLPLFGEWKGTGTGHVALISRTGQLMTLSLHDSQTNKNALIAAESGSGKSFYTNELLTMYMSEGAKCWVVDIGRSYKKLCDVLDGEFISFEETRLPVLNCFELVGDYQEEHGSLIAILQTMISPTGTLTDQQNSVLERVLDEQWNRHEHSLTIDIIAEALAAKAHELNDDVRILDMSTQLYPFTTKGAYGRYFNGKNNIVFNSDFTVLELEELSGHPILRKVVLLELIFQIQQAVFLSEDRSQKKLVMIDEGWDLLKEGQTVKFMEGAYRKFRKYNGSMIIATQSLNDLYSSGNAGKAIAENSAFYFLLHQKPETVEQVKKEKRLDLTDGGYNFLKTVHTVAGAFSELFVKSEAGTGVGRLIVSDFQKLLYSTDPNDVQAINNYVHQGLTYAKAIDAVLKDRNLYHDFTPALGQSPWLSEEFAREREIIGREKDAYRRGIEIMQLAAAIQKDLEAERGEAGEDTEEEPEGGSPESVREGAA